mgnify:CR=1 FL=1
MKADAVVKALKKRLGAKLLDSRIDKCVLKVKKKFSTPSVWVNVEQAGFMDAVKEIYRLQPSAHFVIISGYELDGKVELIYHFSLGYAKQFSELAVNMKIVLPKTKLSLPTITGIVPGALISEREIQEMLGIKIEGIPDSRRLFLDESFPKNVFPWRQGKEGPGRLVRNMHKGAKK